MTEAALAAMDASELRGLIRDILPWLDEPTHARLVNALVDRAARNASGWVSKTPTEQAVTEIVAFAEAATRIGYADPSKVDDHLRQGSNAFLAKDYRMAFQIFRVLLRPLRNGDIDLGQHEMLDEVLGVNIAACAAQYVVAVYMTAAPECRGEAVPAAIDEVHELGHFWEPLCEIERVAVETLPGFGEFLPEWRALIEDRAQEERRSDWDSDVDRWLREVVQRMEGAEGLAKLLASAPGLGWSGGEHPGHLLFPFFCSLLTGTPFDTEQANDFEELSAMSERDKPCLAVPEIASLIGLAGVTVPGSEKSREAVLSAMRKAAEKRIAAVTANKRRRHYEHAAALALTCVRIDPSGSTAWMGRIRREYNRYPALQRELTEHG